MLIDHHAPPGEWIRRAGEDIACGSVVLTAGQRLGPQMLGLAASVGCAALPVFRRLRVALFSTGDELVMPGEPLPRRHLQPNRYVLRGLLEALGCQVSDLGIVPDSLAPPAPRCAAPRRQQRPHHHQRWRVGGREDHVKPAV